VRIVCVSDLHLDARTAGVERFDEIVESCEEAVAFAIDAEDGRADLFAFCGDLCDSDDGRDVLRASAYAVDVAVRLHNRGVHSLWIAGNHDVVADGFTTTLDPLKGLQRFELPPTKVMVATSSPRSWELKVSQRTYVLVALPYSPEPYNAAAAWEEHVTSHGGHSRSASGVFSTKHPTIVFSHLMLPGMHPGSESKELARGKDRAFPLEAMKARPVSLVLNGHYHRRVVTPDGVQIVGSLATLTFGEEYHEPGYLVVDV
jgi:DNA repair exonuclease SbcCD nuclease subunit